MSLLARFSLAFALAAALTFPTWAAETAVPNAAPALVVFASDEGLARLSRSDAKADFPALANQFEAQSNSAFCGPTTAAIVLNAMLGRSPDLPHQVEHVGRQPHVEEVRLIDLAGRGPGRRLVEHGGQAVQVLHENRN